MYYGSAEIRQRTPFIPDEKGCNFAVAADKFMPSYDNLEHDPAFDVSPIHKRGNLPQQKHLPHKPHMLRLLKAPTGFGDLGNFIRRGVFPATMHKPLTKLQQRAEWLQYSHLLDEAAGKPKGSEIRLLLVTAFHIAACSTMIECTAYKPLKPVECETFELVDADRGFKMLMEEVYQNHQMHHCTSCWKVWACHWSIEAEVEPRLQFCPLSASVKYHANFVAEVTFGDGDSYGMTLPGGRYTGLASSQQSFVYGGKAVVTHKGTNIGTEVDLREPGILSINSRHKIKGHLTRFGKRKDGVLLKGFWDRRLLAVWPDESVVVLWQRDASPRPQNVYNLSSFAVQLNHLPAELRAVLPPTDSRWRPDSQAIERGCFNEADKEQSRIVFLNRPADAKAVRAALGKAIWFEPQHLDSDSMLSHRYVGGYWETRAAKAAGDASAWDKCPDIFGLASDIRLSTASRVEQIFLQMV